MKSKEAYMQSECVKWFRLAYPKFAKLLIAIPNGGSRNQIEARNLKLQGVTAGASDLFLFWPSGEFHGLALEAKTGKNKQTDNQVEWQQLIEKAGYKYEVFYNFDEFRDIIQRYMALL